MLNFWRRQRRLNLALEGGGAHGAFTWGVLDRLMEDDALEVAWISGTSAGAVNAVALAAGLAEGGRASARAKLRAVWEAVAKAGVPDLLRNNPWFAGLSKSNAMAQVASLFSPYDFNPLNFDPLRKLLEAHIDFALLRTSPGPELLIAATDVASGRPRLFRRRDLVFDFDGRPAHDLGTQPPHRGVDHVRALLDDLRQNRRPRRLNLLRDLAQYRLGRLGVIEIEERSHEQPVRAAEQHAKRPADDPDEQADHAAARGADVGVVPDVALDLDAAVEVACDDRSAGDRDLALRIELLEVRQRLVGVRVVVRVVAEGDDQHVVG